MHVLIELARHVHACQLVGQMHDYIYNDSAPTIVETVMIACMQCVINVVPQDTYILGIQYI